MKTIAKKTTLILALLTMVSQPVLAQTGGGVPINDTLIFSLFVVAAIIFLIIIYAQISAVKGVLENKKVWMNGDDNSKSGITEKAGMIVAFMFLSQTMSAQGNAVEPLITMTDQMYWLLIGVDAFLLGIIISLHFMLSGLIKSFRGVEEKEADIVTQFTASLTDAVPIEREAEVMLDHDYDGIKELDNNLPPWWKYGFYLTIIFAFVYIIRFHVIGSGQLMIAEYDAEVAEAEIQIAAYNATQANLVDESNLTALTEGARLEAGKKVFMDNCKICHGEFGEGMVGPNFTDKYWKHGGGIKDIFNTIKVGVPDKGMISWESQLTPSQILEVSSFILTMQGTNPPNQKAPEGDLWEEEVNSTPVPEEVPQETPTQIPTEEEKV